MRKRLIPILVAATLVAVAGCSSDGDAGPASSTTEDAPAATTEPAVEGDAPVSADAWAATVCADFDDWLTAMNDARDAVPDAAEPDRASAKGTLTDLFASAALTTEDLITDLEAAGEPAVDEGADVAAALVDAFEVFRDASLTARDDAAALDTESDGFDRDVDVVVLQFTDAVDDVTTLIGVLDEQYPSPELQAALTDSCTL